MDKVITTCKETLHQTINNKLVCFSLYLIQLVWFQLSQIAVHQIWSSEEFGPHKVKKQILILACNFLSSQNPSRRTRWRWCNRLSNTTSFRNSCTPCTLKDEALLMATILPSSMIPRYTFPKPPAPISCASLKLSVAFESSRNVYLFTPLGMSQGPSAHDSPS